MDRSRRGRRPRFDRRPGRREGVLRRAPASHRHAGAGGRRLRPGGAGRRYEGFLRRWDRPDPVPAAPDDLARSLLLLTEWLQIIRTDPRLPLRHLPPDWPAEKAQRLCHALHQRFKPEAAAIADELLDTVPDLCWAEP
ncbi:PaaX family transcriptional regulator C-terminal domain-containing protein [Nonomuraea ferruginea]